MTTNQEQAVKLAREIISKNPSTTLSEKDWALILLAINDPYKPLKEPLISVDAAMKILDNFQGKKGYFETIN